RRMLGETVDLDVVTAGADTTAQLPTESDVGAQVKRLRAHLDETVRQLGITPAAVKRIVDTALELARQQPLRPYHDDKHVAEARYAVPPLTGSWQRAPVGLTEKLKRPDGQPPRQLPVAFDPAVAAELDGQECVLAHLHPPLVAMSTRLLRAAVSNQNVGLHRV